MNVQTAPNQTPGTTRRSGPCETIDTILESSHENTDVVDLTTSTPFSNSTLFTLSGHKCQIRLYAPPRWIIDARAPKHHLVSRTWKRKDLHDLARGVARCGNGAGKLKSQGSFFILGLGAKIPFGVSDIGRYVTPRVTTTPCFRRKPWVLESSGHRALRATTSAGMPISLCPVGRNSDILISVKPPLSYQARWVDLHGV